MKIEVTLPITEKHSSKYFIIPKELEKVLKLKEGDVVRVAIKWKDEWILFLSEYTVSKSKYQYVRKNGRRKTIRSKTRLIGIPKYIAEKLSLKKGDLLNVLLEKVEKEES